MRSAFLLSAIVKVDNLVHREALLCYCNESLYRFNMELRICLTASITRISKRYLVSLACLSQHKAEGVVLKPASFGLFIAWHHPTRRPSGRLIRKFLLYSGQTDLRRIS
jgi:hypothetical protein